jgi:hypothetical protein
MPLHFRRFLAVRQTLGSDPALHGHQIIPASQLR